MASIRGLVALMLITLLLLASASIVVAKPDDRDRREPENAPGDARDLREKAEKELEIAEGLLEKVALHLGKMENKSHTKIGKLVMEARDNLDKAKDLLDRNPARSLALSKHVQALMKLIIRNLGDVDSLGGGNKSASQIESSEEVSTETLPMEPGNDSSQVMSNISTEEVVPNVKENYTVNAQTSQPAANFSINITTYEVGLENETVMVKAVRMENDTVHEETMVASGNQTIIMIRRGPELGNESIEVRVTIEKNQSIVGALIEVKPDRNMSSKIIDEALRIEPLEFGENLFRFQISAPNETSGRLIIVKLDPKLFTIDKLDEIRVLVNGSAAILASSIIDLTSDIYEEPAYVFVISSEGISVLIYIPHFSSYTIDIVGVIRETLSSLENLLSQVLTRDTFVASTILATVILMISASLYVRRKSMLYRI